MYFIFENNMFMFATMGLSGGWAYYNNLTKKYIFSDVVKDYSKYMPKDKIDNYKKNALAHTNVELKTKTGALYFYDMLSFGTLKVISNIEDLHKKLNQLGPDIMDPHTNFEVFKNKICSNKNLNKKIGIVLIDQKTISGIGNYLRSDILYISKINPFRNISDISEKELKTIYNNSKVLTWGDYDMNKGIEMGIIKPSTKLPTDYDRLFYVYNQLTDIAGNKVIKKELYEGSQKRFIYYVTNVQK